jgi:predicted Rossmann fold nucleotide-binding protein DprA/Smf involved in DNA uptake
MSDSQWIDWSALEQRIPDEEKASFQQQFTQLARPDPEAAQVAEQQVYSNEMTESIQAVLSQLEKEGKAKSEGGKMLIDRKLIPDSFQKYV